MKLIFHSRSVLVSFTVHLHLTSGLDTRGRQLLSGLYRVVWIERHAIMVVKVGFDTIHDTRLNA